MNVLVGLHPNAHQFLAEIPAIRTRERQVVASFDEDGFAWLDTQGQKCLPDDIINRALETLREFLLANMRQR